LTSGGFRIVSDTLVLRHNVVVTTVWMFRCTYMGFFQCMSFINRLTCTWRSVNHAGRLNLTEVLISELSSVSQNFVQLVSWCLWQTDEFSGEQRRRKGTERGATFAVSTVVLCRRVNGANDTDRLINTGLRQARLYQHVSLVSGPVPRQLSLCKCRSTSDSPDAPAALHAIKRSFRLYK